MDPNKLLQSLKEVFGDGSVEMHDESIYIRSGGRVDKTSERVKRPAVVVIRLSKRGGWHVQLVSLSLPLMAALSENETELKDTSIETKNRNPKL